MAYMIVDMVNDLVVNMVANNEIDLVVERVVDIMMDLVAYDGIYFMVKTAEMEKDAAPPVQIFHSYANFF